MNRFQAYSKRSQRRESGGVLLGNVWNSRVEVLSLTGPSKFDVSGWNFFLRTIKSHQPKIDKAWKRSSGKLIYVGEWHTHPVPNPTPSGDDQQMIMTALETTIMEIEFLFLIIVGTNNTLWIGKKTKNKLEPLKKIF